MPRGVYDRKQSRWKPNIEWAREPWTCEKCGHEGVRGGNATHMKWCVRREEHFWSKVEKTDSCWLYRGTIGFEGYGYVNHGRAAHRKQYQAHRYSWLLLKGPIGEDLCVLHKCDVRNCVNPAHLYLGDRQDNSNDMVARGRKNHRYMPVEELHWPELSKRVKNGGIE